MATKSARSLIVGIMKLVFFGFLRFFGKNFFGVYFEHSDSF